MRTPSVPRSNRRTALALVAILALSMSTAACGGGGSSDGGVTNPGGNPTPVDPIATSQVTISGNSFVPRAIVVAVGTSVSFTNNDAIAHNVTFSSTGIQSTGDFSGGTQSVTMPSTPGTYDYRCTIHAGMTGTVKVQ